MCVCVCAREREREIERKRERERESRSRHCLLQVLLLFLCVRAVFARAPKEQNMIKRHLPRIMYHQVYFNQDRPRQEHDLPKYVTVMFCLETAGAKFEGEQPCPDTAS